MTPSVFSIICRRVAKSGDGMMSYLAGFLGELYVELFPPHENNVDRFDA